MPYTSAQVDQAVTYLTARIQGLTREAARVWVLAEQGVNNNVLGVTYRDASGGQHLFAYPTLAMGAEAAARLFNTSSYYTAARKAIASTSDVAAQLQAIAASPWNGGHYAKSTVFAPYLGGSASPPTSSPPATGDLAGFGYAVSFPVGHVLTVADVDSIYDALRSSGQFSGDTFGIAHQLAYGTLRKYIGRRWDQALLGEIQAALGVTATEANAAGQAVGGALGAASQAVVGAVAPILVNGTILVVVIVLAGAGVRRVLA